MFLTSRTVQYGIGDNYVSRETKVLIQDQIERRAVYALSLRAKCSAGLYLTPKRVITETGLLDLKEEVGARASTFFD